ncbi:DUF3306 domain-containing protein [Sedimenticola sp.]|uniref:DUF3306 domain-containing protein n=1 Tax=Sedimenticola sp. TaxID=1940285 RepID=UPI003D09F0F0
MSGEPKKPTPVVATDDFVSRWSRLKRASAQTPAGNQEASPPAPVEAEKETRLPTDADMPPIDSLDETSDYTGFLSEKVSEALRRQALRKLFHSEAFNVCDGLDDYAGDFTSFAALGDIVTADMRHQLALAKEKLTAALDSDSTAAPTATDDPASANSDVPPVAEQAAPEETDRDDTAPT